jgi:DNA processing protein
MSAGPHQLIKNLRAQLITCGDDLAKHMGWKKPESTTQTVLFPELGQNELEVMGCLQSNPLHVDELLQVYPHDRGNLMKVLLEMEMKGLVKALPGSRFGLCSGYSG